MALQFHDVLLDPSYSNLAEGGPEFSTVLLGAGEGGAITFAAESREDFISRYSIDFDQLIPARRKALLNFGILRKGMLRAFRFLAPDDRDIENEICGVLNNSTGEIELLESTNGTTTRFFICKYFVDQFSSYLRWITHPSPLDELTIQILDDDGITILGTGTFGAGYVSGRLPQTRSVTISGYGSVTVYYRLGILQFSTAPSTGKLVKVISGVYHHPVHFASDWFKFSVDDGNWSKIQIELNELLPIAVGLTPAMDLPDIPDEEPPTFTIDSLTSTSSSVTVNYTATDNVAVAQIELEIDIVE